MPPKKKASTRKTKVAAAAAAAEAQAAAEAAAVSETIATEAEPTADTTIVAAETDRDKDQKVQPQETTTTETIQIIATQETAEATVAKTITTTTTTKPVKEKTKETADQDQDMREVDSSPSDEKNAAAPSTMAERLERLKGLRQKMSASKQANRSDLIAEHQRSKVNRREVTKKERAREDAEKLIAKRDAEEAGIDHERSQFWSYSAESVERWNEKQDAKKIRMDNQFTDWDQVNHKKYLKQVGELKPNVAAYNAKKEAAMHTNEDGELVVASDSGFYRDANSVAFLSDPKPNILAVDRMAADVAKQIDARTRFSKRRAHKDDDDVNYINDANQRFNQKISRFYDKFTKEIRDDFERGTALITGISEAPAQLLLQGSQQARSMELGHNMQEVRVKKEPDEPLQPESDVPRLNKGDATMSDRSYSGGEKTGNGDEDEGSDDEGEDVYEVERVVGHQHVPGRGLYYFLKWKGYAEKDNTWEPESAVYCHGYVNEYWTRYEASGGKRSDRLGLEQDKQKEKGKSPTSFSRTDQDALLPDLTPLLNQARPPEDMDATNVINDQRSEGGGTVPPKPLEKHRKDRIMSVGASKSKPSDGGRNRDQDQDRTRLTPSLVAHKRRSKDNLENTYSKSIRSDGAQERITAKDSTTSTVSSGDSRTNGMMVPSRTKGDDIGSENSAWATSVANIKTESNSHDGTNEMDLDDSSKRTKVNDADDWIPPASWESWEDHVDLIDSVEQRSVAGKRELVVHLQWKSGKRTEHLSRDVHKRCPQKLLDFYESHLIFREELDE
ncbi:hypothetical protein BGZ65_006443 [Modicella reniformis]|uniref:Pre-mRNA-splicing factor SYF2 n=1 Tax=Modicella reniformis TaxID=1440133 RepID=A0A9P6IKL8_9FUNG|nr:hypothetical protein BGZ65_006443 [Modicella reniformis]